MSMPSDPISPARPNNGTPALEPPPAREPGAPPRSPVPPPGPKRTASRQRPVLIVGAAGALIGLAVLGYGLITAGHETTDDAFVEADIVTIAAEVGGRVTEVLVHDNQAVASGDVVLKLDARELEASVAAARAELAIAEAAVRSAEAQSQIAAATAEGGLDSARALVMGSTIGVESAKPQIETARVAVARARADADRTALDLRRATELLQHQSIAQEAVDHARLADAAARSALLQAEANQRVAEQMEHAAKSRVAEARGKLLASTPVSAQVEVVQAAVALAHARVDAARAALARAELRLSRAVVTAPRAGTISKVSVEPGELISENQPLAAVVPDEMYVVANFKETQLSGLTAGKHARIALDAYPGRTLEGTVASLSGATGARFALLPPDNASGNFVKVVQRVPVRIELAAIPDDLPLRAGLSAEVTVDLDPPSSPTLVSGSAARLHSESKTPRER